MKPYPLDTTSDMPEQFGNTQGSAGCAPVSGWTAPSSIPCDVAKKILAARNAIISGDDDEAYHQLYSIADPTFSSYEPWKILEQSNDKLTDRHT